MNTIIGLALAFALAWLSAPDEVHAEEMNAEHYAARAVRSVQDGNRAEALADFNKAVELASDKPIHYRNRAAFFALTKEWDKAIADYDMVLKLESNDPATRFNRGYAYIQLGKLDRALPDFDEVLQAQPDNDRALRFRAYIYAAQKQEANAVEDLTKLIRKNPNDPQNYKARADANAAQAKWSAAITDYGKALELNPKDLPSMSARAIAYLHAGDKDRELSDLNAVLNIKPDNLECLKLRAQANYEENQFDAAIADYSKIIELKPGDASPYAARGFARLKKEDKSGALKDFTKAIEVMPDDSSYYEARLYIYNSENDSEKALGDLIHLIALQPDRIELYLQRANLYLKLTKYDESLADYEKVLATEPKNVSALAGKGEAIARKGDRKAGAEQLREALRLATDPKEKEAIQAKLRATVSARSSCSVCRRRKNTPPDALPTPQIFEFRLDVGAIVAAAVVSTEVRVIGIVVARCRIWIWIWIWIWIRVSGLIGGTLVNLATVFVPLVVIIIDDFRVFHGCLSAQESTRWCEGSGKRTGVMADQTFYSLKQQGAASDSSGGRQCALQKSSGSAPARGLRHWRRVTVRLRRCGLCGLGRYGRGWGWRRALWLWLRVSASEKAGHACEKTSARLLSARGRIGLGELLLECGDSILRIRDGLLHHENTLGQQVGSGRNLSELAPNQLISFGILGLTTRLA